MKLRATNAGVNLTVSVNKCLSYLTQTQPSVKDAIRPVLEIRLDMFVVNALIDTRSVFLIMFKNV